MAGKTFDIFFQTGISNRNLVFMEKKKKKKKNVVAYSNIHIMFAATNLQCNLNN